jgi:DNA polymerase III delta prime subunit
MKEEFLFVEKYRPKTVEETILPDDLKNTFQTFVDTKNIPNLILSGTAGVGKTTIAKAMLEELGCDYIVINGSDEGRSIDVLRNEIKNFASSVSFAGGRKYVILDEADYLNANSTQPALRNFMEEYSKNCGFILTCNFLNRIIEPLHSRCSVIQFRLSKEDKPKMAAQFFKRVQNILKTENIEYDDKVVAELIKKYFPDNRRVLNEIQRYSVTGKIDAGILSKMSDVNISELMNALRDKEFSTVRKWAALNVDGETTPIFRKIYDSMYDYVKPESIPQVVVTLADYQYKSAFVADYEINMVACLTELMVDCEWK